MAVQNNYDVLVEKMIINGEYHNSGYNSDGWTHLKCLANGNSGKNEKNKKTIKLLLRKGANPDRHGFRYCLPSGSSARNISYKLFKDHLKDYDTEFQTETLEYI